jgi:hypothetical protein
MNLIDKAKKDQREFTERMKETLGMFLEIKKARDRRNPVVRNYGMDLEIQKFKI